MKHTHAPRTPPAASRPGRSPDSPGMSLRDRVIAALQGIQDPELPVDIWNLGLIYGVEIDDLGRVDIRMTLTTPACPLAEGFPEHVEDVVEDLEGVTVCRVELVWDPPWDASRLSDAARASLGVA